ncbi:AlpA family phage regulatory protein [Cupriavidus sp. SZY C1]|uniref:helix-turn-helix transcriptional regulator n=1 Tax=Cupriavidus sp. SZY C1 TaxID=3055037 RepID=UPI0028B70C0F|nr:helix-turn-helix domain-containing protein [Cupriavidus sp. SZY C1]MDT6962243.1 AlpA family phage regulatory protein [Cupriavidus sp. SZY C1]
MPEHAASSTTLSFPQLINKQELCERLSVSERTIENMVKADAFPPPVRIGKQVFWSETAVRQWQRALFAAQENWSPSVTPSRCRLDQFVPPASSSGRRHRFGSQT